MQVSGIVNLDREILVHRIYNASPESDGIPELAPPPGLLTTSADVRDIPHISLSDLGHHSAS